MHVDELNLLETILATKTRTWIVPRQFFISWNGVPTLAYRGFSPTLLDIKREIEERVPEMKPEYPGAKWPKTTLGALRDGRVLSMDDARTLLQICHDLKHEVGSEAALEVSEVSAVVFYWRSLERRLVTHPISLRTDQSSFADHAPPQENLEFVDSIMSQFTEDNLVEYLPRLQAEGNRESHYRSTHVEATLVFDIGNQLERLVQRFTEIVDRELPVAYRWFSPKSRHMTVRGLA